MGAPRVHPGDLRSATIAKTVDAARELVAAGMLREQAAADLVAAAPDRAVLEAAHVEMARRMHFGPSDDFGATAGLRLVQAALRLVPYVD